MSSEINIKNVDFTEVQTSQLPMVDLLVKLGWQYLPTEELNKARDNDLTKPILQNIAFKAMREFNSFEYNDENNPFSDSNIRSAIAELNDMPFESYAKTGVEVYKTLLIGRDLKEILGSRSKSFHFDFIDYNNIENNIFQVAVEVPFKSATGSIRADIVLFVNGIPLVIIENKRSAVEVAEAMNQLKGYQNNVPKPFLFTQILIATNSITCKYGTTLTPNKFYSVWKNKDENDRDDKVLESKIYDLIQQPLDCFSKLVKDLNSTGKVELKHDRAITNQDKTTYLMLKPSILLELVKTFVVYDKDIKKVARYQQFYAVKKTLEKIKQGDIDTLDKRPGGLVWHTQGSGKSLTMVMLSRAIIDDKDLDNPIILVITDRKDLNKQIKQTFTNCRLKVDADKKDPFVYSPSNRYKLKAAIEANKTKVLTTLIHKFRFSEEDRLKPISSNKNLFILIDEAHRTQSGDLNEAMMDMLPNACTIAFTGTPLMKAEKLKQTSASKFGGYIDKYTIDNAIDDGNVLKIMYEGKYTKIKQLREEVEAKLDNDPKFKALTDEQQKRLKREVTYNKILATDNVIKATADDIAKHFKSHALQYRTGFKGQLACHSKSIAIKYQKYFEENHKEIKTAVIISESPTDKNKENKEKRDVQQYLEGMLKGNNIFSKEFPSMEKYDDAIIKDYKNNEDGIQIIIVVSKLLTGFDAPRNTYLYLNKILKDHDLLQAIARVNRLCEDTNQAKTAGFVIDYSLNSENIKNAMELFNDNYDSDDVSDSLFDLAARVKDMEKALTSLNEDIFKDVKTNDINAYVKSLEDQARYESIKNRSDFKDEILEEISMFSKQYNAFINAYSDCKRIDDFRDQKKYRDYARLYTEVLKILSVNYKKDDDLSSYKHQLYDILNNVMQVEEIDTIVEEIDIRKLSTLKSALDKMKVSDRSKAESIAAQANKVISEKFESDPEFYKTFEEKIEEVLSKVRLEKQKDSIISEALLELEAIHKEVSNKENIDVMDNKLGEFESILYRNIGSEIDLSEEDKHELLVNVSNKFKEFIVVGWDHIKPIQNDIFNKLEDYIFDEYIFNKNHKHLKPKIDLIIDSIIKYAIQNKHLFKD